MEPVETGLPCPRKQVPHRPALSAFNPSTVSAALFGYFRYEITNGKYISWFTRFYREFAHIPPSISLILGFGSNKRKPTTLRSQTLRQKLPLEVAQLPQARHQARRFHRGRGRHHLRSLQQHRKQASSTFLLSSSSKLWLGFRVSTFLSASWQLINLY